MASCSISATETGGEGATVPNWLELPTDIIRNILQRLDTIDIVEKACIVCPLWWNICKDPLMWSTIRMIGEGCYFNVDLPKICRYAVERSCGHLEEISIEYFATDELLEFIVENGTNLRCMRLVECQYISNEGFCKAVRKLLQLEELEISLCSLLKESLEVLGRSCRLLKSLIFSREWDTPVADDGDALIISETMSRLCRLCIKGNSLTDVGLLAILNGCPRLESLDIGECYFVELSQGLEERCLEQIRDLLLPFTVDYQNFF